MSYPSLPRCLRWPVGFGEAAAARRALVPGGFGEFGDARAALAACFLWPLLSLLPRPASASPTPRAGRHHDGGFDMAER